MKVNCTDVADQLLVISEEEAAQEELPEARVNLLPVPGSEFVHHAYLFPEIADGFADEALIMGFI